VWTHPKSAPLHLLTLVPFDTVCLRFCSSFCCLRLEFHRLLFASSFFLLLTDFYLFLSYIFLLLSRPSILFVLQRCFLSLYLFVIVNSCALPSTFVLLFSKLLCSSFSLFTLLLRNSTSSTVTLLFSL